PRRPPAVRAAQGAGDRLHALAGGARRLPHLLHAPRLAAAQPAVEPAGAGAAHTAAGALTFRASSLRPSRPARGRADHPACLAFRLTAHCQRSYSHTWLSRYDNRSCPIATGTAREKIVMVATNPGVRLEEIAQEVFEVFTHLGLTVPPRRRRTGGLKEIEF